LYTKFLEVSYSAFAAKIKRQQCLSFCLSKSRKTTELYSVCLNQRSRTKVLLFLSPIVVWKESTGSTCLSGKQSSKNTVLVFLSQQKSKKTVLVFLSQPKSKDNIASLCVSTIQRQQCSSFYLNKSPKITVLASVSQPKSKDDSAIVFLSPQSPKITVLVFLSQQKSKEYSASLSVSSKSP
jgi:hypothetical protein